MNTTNIISTPDITGNIGSCTTQKELVVVNSNLWKDTGTTIATNSCTGVVEKYDYSSINMFPMAMLGLLIILFIIICCANVSNS